MLLEAALRLAGHHKEYSLFVPSPAQTGYLQASPDVIKRYFNNPNTAPALAIETAYFRESKTPGTLRIFVQGGSTAAGFPYGYGASLAGMLGQRLNRLMPDTPIEVISTAMAAVTSYTLLDFADEIIEQQPDAVLIYAGHNEYLGVLGVGSTLSSGLSPALTRATMRLRRTAVYQLIARLLNTVGRDTDSSERDAGRTLMARIAGQKAIPYGSATYATGRDQFRGNLDRLLAKYQRADIPVIVGLLASNERDLPPFVGGATPGADTVRLDALLADGVAALAAGALDEAKRHIDAAIAVDDGAADAWHARGRLLARRGQYAAAREAYLEAKDRDQLRFRAPEEFNLILRETAAWHGAEIADVPAALASASPQGIIGHAVMLEHVHPNLDGYFLLADAFFDALFQTGVLRTQGALPSDTSAREEIPVSEVDRLFGEYRLQTMINDWPFVSQRREPNIPEPTNEVESFAHQMFHRRLSWPQATGRLIAHYRRQGNLAEETRVALILADALPFSPRAQFAAGTALIRSGRAREAPRYLERPLEVTPDDVNTLLALGHALLLSGQSQRARKPLTRALQLDPDNTSARDALEQLDRRSVN